MWAISIILIIGASKHFVNVSIQFPPLSDTGAPLPSSNTALSYELNNRIDTHVWGWFPALSIVGAFGVLLVAIAHSIARYDSPWSQHMYWVANLVIFVPLATRLLMPGLRRREAIACVLWLGASLYSVKLFQSPLGFSFFDEFLHWRTASDMLVTGRLFYENSLLPVSPLYPALEIVATALVNVTGLSIFHAGALLILVARCVLVLAVYLFFERISGSVRAAGVGAALYMCNSHFIIFDAQFAYESLALATSLSLLYTLLLRSYVRGGQRYGLDLLVALFLWSLVATHHATSYITAIFLMLWAVVQALHTWRVGGKTPGLFWVAIFAIVTNVIWLLSVSRITIGYLAPHLEGAVSSVLGMIAGENSGRELFKSSSGIQTPLLEKIVGLATPMLMAMALPIGLWTFWKQEQHSSTAWVMAMGACLFPITTALRLTGGGWEISARAAVFVALPLSYIVGIGIITPRLPWFMARWERLAGYILYRIFPFFMAVVYCGGIITGWSPWARMPWPYMVGADTRSVEPHGLAAAAWANDKLGRNNRMAADRINTTLMGTYGGQRMITHLIDHVVVSGIFLASRLGPEEYKAIREGRIQYLTVDMRVSHSLALDGYYYESWEQMVATYHGPPRASLLRKFDVIPQINTVFDSGDIRIYDIRALQEGSDQ